MPRHQVARPHRKSLSALAATCTPTLEVPEAPVLALNSCVLESLLLRCDGCIRTLNLSFSSRYLNSETGAVISVLCPNLEYLDASGVRLNNTSVQLLAEGCPKLKTAILMRCIDVDDIGIRRLLRLCKDLELLNLTAMHKLSGECFGEAAVGLRRLHLDGCWGLTMEGLATIATKCSSLAELSLSRCIQATDREMNLLCMHLKALKTFRLSGSFPGLTPASVGSIANLSLLEHLDLSHNRHITDAAITAICAGCTKLRSLNLTGCQGNVGDTTLLALAQCPSLRSLKVNYLRVTDGGLKGIACQGQLRSVEARGCSAVTHEGVEALVKQCPHLELLDVSGCRLVGNRAVTDCVDIVRERPSVLTFVVGGTRVRAHQLDLDPKGKLKLDTRNYSMDYCGTDRWDHMLFYDDRLYDLDYWDDDYDYDYEDGADEDVWDLELDGEEPVAELDAEEALAGGEGLEGGIPPADLAGPQGIWAPPGYLQDLLDLPPSDEEDWPYDYYDHYGIPLDDPLSEEEAWAQGYYDYDDLQDDGDLLYDPQEEDDILDQDDLGIEDLFHDRQEEEGEAQAQGGVEIADLLDDRQETDEARAQGGVEIADLLDDRQEADEAQAQSGVEIANLLDHRQEVDEAQACDSLEVADLLDDRQEEPWAREDLEYGHLLDDRQDDPPWAQYYTDYDG